MRYQEGNFNNQFEQQPRVDASRRTTVSSYPPSSHSLTSSLSSSSNDREGSSEISPTLFSSSYTSYSSFDNYPSSATSSSSSSHSYPPFLNSGHFVPKYDAEPLPFVNLLQIHNSPPFHQQVQTLDTTRLSSSSQGPIPLSQAFEEEGDSDDTPYDSLGLEGLVLPESILSRRVEGKEEMVATRAAVEVDLHLEKPTSILQATQDLHEPLGVQTAFISKVGYVSATFRRLFVVCCG